MIDSNEFTVYKTDKYHLCRRIGTRTLCLISDPCPDTILLLHDNIKRGDYPSDTALFDDIYARYADKSLLRPGIL